MEVKYFEDNCTQQLLEFLRRVWDKDITEKEFVKRRENDMSKNPYAKEGGFPIAIAIKNDQIIGHHAATPVHLWVNGKEYLSYWMAGLHVLPEGRRQGIAKKLKNQTNQLPLKTGFWVVETTSRINQRLGWTVVGKIPEYIKVLDSEKMIKSIDFSKLNLKRNEVKKVIQKMFSNTKSSSAEIFKRTLKIQNYIFNAFFSNRRIKHKISQIKHFDMRVDHLWDRNKDRIKCAQVRKSCYLNWQFKQEHGWIKIIAENNCEVVGYAILCLKKIKKVRYLSGLDILSVIDIFWDFKKPEAYWDLLQYVEKIGLDNNAAVLICSVSEKRARKILISNGYFRIPGTVHFGYHCNENGLALSPNLEDWFITRGDADAAGSLGPDRMEGNSHSQKVLSK